MQLTSGVAGPLYAVVERVFDEIDLAGCALTRDTLAEDSAADQEQTYQERVMGTHQQQMRGFARYNLEFNGRLFDLLGRLSDDDRKKDMGAFFGSVHGTLNHILLADRIWLGRFSKAFPSMSSLHGPALVHEFSSLSQELYADFSELRTQRSATDRVIVDWAEQLTEELLAKQMSYRNSQGDLREHPAWIVVAHMFNHQTHHRGQITTLVHQLGHDPGVTDYIAYVQ
jgi:uncharacterized damage-inducible protein DinB